MYASIFRAVVSESLRLRIEDAGLRGPAFQETILSDEAKRRLKKQRKAEGDEYPVHWELISDVMLPPLSGRNVLLNGNGTPWQGNPITGPSVFRGVGVSGGANNEWEVHYSGDEVRQMDPFDLALTRERTSGWPKSWWPGKNYTSPAVRRALRSSGSWCAGYRGRDTDVAGEASSGTGRQNGLRSKSDQAKRKTGNWVFLWSAFNS